MLEPRNLTARLLVPLCAVCVLWSPASAVAQGSERAQHVNQYITSGRAGRGADAASFESGAFRTSDLLEALSAPARGAGSWLVTWYSRTAPADRVVWGGLTACAGLGLFVVLERLLRLRRRKVVPAGFTARFLERLHEGKLNCGQALDHCELNPSPAARIALAAVRRWGRPASDLERALALAHRVETERLKRNVGTLRRIAGLAPLLGLLGTLLALASAFESMSGVMGVAAGTVRAASPSVGPFAPPVPWGHALAAALSPLTAGVVIATLALLAYDGLLVRIEKLAGLLDRLGAETLDAIALLSAAVAPGIAPAGAASRLAGSKPEPAASGVPPRARTPHQPLLRPEEGMAAVARQEAHESGF